MSNTHDGTNDFRDALSITGVILGGFQVFDQPTTIPLGPLTFLFGPNSSGKSAVEDALDILGEILGRGANLRPNEEVLFKNWRKTSGFFLQYAPTMTIGLSARSTLRLPGALYGYFLDDWNRFASEANDSGQDVSVVVTYMRSEEDMPWTSLPIKKSS